MLIFDHPVVILRFDVLLLCYRSALFFLHRLLVGTFSAEVVVTTNAEQARSVFGGDFNGDSLLDLASASQFDNKIAVYLNTPTSPGTWHGRTC